MLPLDEHQQRVLLRIAREALKEAVIRFSLSEEPSPSPELSQPCGAFVSLHHGEMLRGCIGHIEAIQPLYQTVRECAVAAALHDPRFDPVQPEELPDLRLEISVMSPLFEITPAQVEVGKHGLLISRGLRRGLLLPQVPLHLAWDRERFLCETCRKAGLEPDAWQHGARIQAFTAQVFAETDVPAPVKSSHHAA